MPTLPAVVERSIVSHARDASPRECCGLLLGSADAILEAVPASNIADDPERRYTVDPRDHFRALRTARARGLDVIGAYHSHPRSAARPSATDAAEAFGDFLFVIVGLAVDPPEITAWTCQDGNFTPVPLVRSP